MKNKAAEKRPNKYTTLSDAEIIVLYQQGDEAAGEALFNRYQTGMLHYATVFVGPYLAQDVMQDTWEALVRGLQDGSYKEEQLFNKYIKGIVYRRSIETRDEERHKGATDKEPEEMPDDALNADEELLKKQSTSLLARMLKKVGKRAARVFVLHLLREKSFKEIGIIMHIAKEVTVRVLYFRTLKELSRLLLPYKGML